MVASGEGGLVTCQMATPPITSKTATAPSSRNLLRNVRRFSNRRRSRASSATPPTTLRLGSMRLRTICSLGSAAIKRWTLAA